MTAGWLLSEMRDPAGGFWSSLDADSEGEEGKFYVFTLDEVRAATGDDFDAAVAAYGFSESGNFEGKNIPIHAGEIEAVQRDRVRDRLLEFRATRTRPGTDDKVLTGWNGLAASALAEAGAALGEPEWIVAAGEAMDFVLQNLRVDGRLMRAYRRGVVKHLGYAEDYAYTLEACLTLFDTTGDGRWFDEAQWAADESLRLFSADDGAFFTTGQDAETLITRPREFVDNAIPAANSVLAMALQKMTLLTGEKSYEEAALGAVAFLADAAGRSPTGFGAVLGALDLWSSNADEVVLVGPDRDTLLDVVRARYRPNMVLVSVADGTEMQDRIPLLRERSATGRATAFVCHRGVCDLPTNDPERLAEQLQP